MSTAQPADNRGEEAGSWGAVERLSPRTVDAHALIEDLRAELASLRRERDQLQTALDSRVVIEQAKGVLVERFRLSPDQAFSALRSGARSSRIRVHSLAAEVVASRTTPPELHAVLHPVNRR
jgi:AmiR/NasT family two-component response regulator